MRLTLATCRPDRHWIVMPLRASLGSLGVVVTSIALVGAIFEFFAGGSFQPLAETSVLRCASTGTDGRAVILSRTVFRGEQPTQYRLWLYDPGCSESPVPIPWTQSRPSCLTWIPGTQQIVVGAWDGAIHLADLTQLERPPQFVGRHLDGGLISLQCSADGKYLASRSARLLRAWELASQQLLWEHAAGQLNCHTIDPQSRSVIGGGDDACIQQWDLHSGTLLRTLAVNRHGGGVYDVEFHVDGRLLATAASPGGVFRGEAHLLDWPVGQNDAWTSENGAWRSGWARRSTISPDGDLLVTTSEVEPSCLDVWDVRSRRHLGALRGHRAVVLGAIFSSDSQLLSWSADGTMRSWDVAHQRLLNVITITAAHG